MPGFRRYAVFFVPTGALYDRAAEWLGWDSVAGMALPPPEPRLVDRPRKYGFHATLKPPFRLAEGSREADLRDTLARIAAGTAPIDLPALTVTALGRFLALTPASPCPAVQRLAAQVVMDLDRFRATLRRDELARRRKSRLSPRQEDHLARWGYPFVLDQFRFHMTLTGPVPQGQVETLRQSLADHFADVLDRSERIADLALMGEDAEGFFHLLRRVPLTGQPR